MSDGDTNLKAQFDLLRAELAGRFNKVDGALDLIRQDQGVLRRDFDRLTGEKGPIADHEERVRSLERWKFALPATLVGGLILGALRIAGVL